MADFCKQCNSAIWGDDDIPSDFEGICAPGHMLLVLCEGCGEVFVDYDGNCLGGVSCEADHFPQPESAVRAIDVV